MRAVVLLLGIAGAACKGDAPAPAPAQAPAPAPPPVPVPTPTGPTPTAPAATATGATPYARDIDRICNVESLVAVDQPGVNPALLTAQYLAANLETQEARDFLARWNGVASGERATTLDAEAVRAGLTACPTARAWDGK